MASAATMDIQMPSSLHNSGNSSTAPTWNTRARKNAMIAEDEYYLQTQMEVLKQGVALFVDKYKANQA